MEELAHCYRACVPNQPELAFDDAVNKITIIELVSDDGGGSVETRILELSGQNKEHWLNTNMARGNEKVLARLLEIRFVNLHIFTRGQLDISRKDFERVTQIFDVTHAVSHGHTSMQSFGQTSKVVGGTKHTYTAVHIADYFAQFHKINGDTGLVEGVYWANERVLPFMRSVIIQQRSLVTHPFFLNLCTAITFDIAITSRLCSTSDLIAGIENRTGFKVWALQRFKPTEGSYPTISAAASGYAASLAANKRLNILERCILKSAAEFIAVHESAVAKVEQHRTDRVTSQIDLLLQENEVQLILIDFLSSRIQTQLTAVR
jgi:hypothetical protein